jgi:hypothetical protein
MALMNPYLKVVYYLNKSKNNGTIDTIIMEDEESTLSCWP